MLGIEEITKIEEHGWRIRDTHSLLEAIPNNTCLSFMILNSNVLFILDLHNRVPPIGVGGHGMKIFCAFISKFDPVFSISIPPIKVSRSEQESKMSLEYVPEILLSVEESSKFF